MAVIHVYIQYIWPTSFHKTHVRLKRVSAVICVKIYIPQDALKGLHFPPGPTDWGRDLFSAGGGSCDGEEHNLSDASVKNKCCFNFSVLFSRMLRPTQIYDCQWLFILAAHVVQKRRNSQAEAQTAVSKSDSSHHSSSE